MRLFVAFMLGVSSLFAQATVKLRDNGDGFYITGGAFNVGSNTMRITVNDSSSVVANDSINLYNIPFVGGVSCGTYNLNGNYKVKGVGAGYIDVMTTAGADLPDLGAWCDGSTVDWPGGAQWGGKTTDYTLVNGLKGWFDGDNGTHTRQLAMGTWNGLVSLSVASNVATVVVPSGYLNNGELLAIWGSGNVTLDRGPAGTGSQHNPYTVSGSGTTFTFTTSGVVDGSYNGVNLNCGPSSNADCLRVSKKAYTGNSWWAKVLAVVGTYGAARHIYDGGTLTYHYDSTAATGEMSTLAVNFFIDQQNTTLRDSLIYWVTHPERFNGSFAAANGLVSGGSYNFGDFGSFFTNNYALMYAVIKDFLTAPQNDRFIGIMVNNLDTPGSCTRWFANPKIINSGAVTAGSTTTVTLGSGSGTDNVYNNMAIQIINSSGSVVANNVITAYNGTTKIATVATSWTAPDVTETYEVQAGIAFTSTGGFNGTLTGYGTQWLTDGDTSLRLATGDIVYRDWIDPYGAALSEYYISSVSSDTSATVITSYTTNVGAGQMRIAKQWTTGTCGANWFQDYWLGSWAQPILYPPSGGNTSKQASGRPSSASNNGYSYSMSRLAIGAALSDDARGAYVFEKAQTYVWNYYPQVTLGISSGYQRAGGYYTNGRTFPDAQKGASYLMGALTGSGYPSYDMTGNWIRNWSKMKIYGDTPYHDGGLVWPAKFGTEVGNNSVQNLVLATYVSDVVQLWQPTDDASKYWQNWVNAHYTGSNVANEFISMVYWWIDPQIPELDYTTLPTQYLFKDTSWSTCNAMGLSLCSSSRLVSEDGLISRTGWGSQSDTWSEFMARNFFGEGDHDNSQAGVYMINKVGYLTGPGTYPVGSQQQGEINTQLWDMVEFGGSNSLRPGRGTGLGTDEGEGVASITRWRGATNYGDTVNPFVYAMSENKDMYTNTIDRYQVSFMHFKKPGATETFINYTDISVASSPTAVRGQLHLPQNLQAAIASSPAEGDTTCTGGCVNLNTNREVIESEANSIGLDTYGLITKWFSPGTIEVRWDGSVYTGSQGNDYRVSVCGSSCGASVSTVDYVQAHKIMANLADTTFTATGLDSADTLFTGVQTSDVVALFARHGLTQPGVAITTTHAGTAQYGIAGLDAGSIAVTRNGTPIAGSPFTVTAGDNTLYFEGLSGNYIVGTASPVVKRGLTGGRLTGTIK